MKKIVIACVAALISLCAAAQDSFLSHMFLPVDAGVSLSARDGIGLPATFVPYISASADPLVLFPTFSVGFNMALE